MKVNIYDAELYPYYFVTSDPEAGEVCELSLIARLFVKVAARLSAKAQRILRNAYPPDE